MAQLNNANSQKGKISIKTLVIGILEAINNLPDNLYEVPENPKHLAAKQRRFAKKLPGMDATSSRQRRAAIEKCVKLFTKTAKYNLIHFNPYTRRECTQKILNQIRETLLAHIESYERDYAPCKTYTVKFIREAKAKVDPWYDYYFNA